MIEFYALRYEDLTIMTSLSEDMGVDVKTILK